jgi:hypothetical protein
MLTVRIAVGAAGLLAVLGGTDSVAAQPAGYVAFASPAAGFAEPPRSVAGISMDEAIRIARRRLDASVTQYSEAFVNGRRVYVLRMYAEKDGRVWTVRVDAETGSIN